MMNYKNLLELVLLPVLDGATSKQKTIIYGWHINSIFMLQTRLVVVIYIDAVWRRPLFYNAP
jgi:hypothetical protein